MAVTKYPALIGRESGFLQYQNKTLQFCFDKSQRPAIEIPVRGLKIQHVPGNTDQFRIVVHGEEIFFQSHELLQLLIQNGADGGQASGHFKFRKSLLWLKIVLPIGLCIALLFLVPLGISLLPEKFLTRVFSRELEAKVGKIIALNHFRADDQNMKQTKILEEMVEFLKSVNPSIAHLDIPVAVMVKSEANAYAVPGGSIFVTSQFITEAESIEEILGVLGHEIGHVELRHNLRNMVSLIGALVGSIAVGVVLGSDAADLIVKASGFLNLNYNREEESDADNRAAEYLLNARVSTSGIADFFRRVQKKNKDLNKSFFSKYLSTHPLSTERIEKFEAHNQKYALNQSVPLPWTLAQVQGR